MNQPKSYYSALHNFSFKRLPILVNCVHQETLPVVNPEYCRGWAPIPKVDMKSYYSANFFPKSA